MTNIHQRVADLVHTVQERRSAISVQFGRDPAYVSGIIRGRQKVGPEFALFLAERYNVNLNWLLRGDGPMFLAPSPARASEAASPYGHEPGVLTSGGVAPGLRIVITDDPARFDQLEGAEHYCAIPYMAGEAAAGEGRVVEDRVIGYVLIHQRIARRPEHLVAVQVHGSSMLPTLPPGSIVALDTTLNAPPLLRGKIVCARTGQEEVVIKRLRAPGPPLVLESDNPDRDEYPPLVISPDAGEQPIIGQVVWAWQDFR